MLKQLLVVDDDPGLLRAVAETLRAEGYEVTTARRGAEALGHIHLGQGPLWRCEGRSRHRIGHQMTQDRTGLKSLDLRKGILGARVGESQETAHRAGQGDKPRRWFGTISHGCAG